MYIYCPARFTTVLGGGGGGWSWPVKLKHVVRGLIVEAHASMQVLHADSIYVVKVALPSANMQVLLYALSARLPGLPLRQTTGPSAGAS